MLGSWKARRLEGWDTRRLGSYEARIKLRNDLNCLKL
jgi:hypothetical protein